MSILGWRKQVLQIQFKNYSGTEPLVIQVRLCNKTVLAHSLQMILVCGVVQFTSPIKLVILMFMQKNQAKIGGDCSLLLFWRVSILIWHLIEIWEFLQMVMTQSKGKLKVMMFTWSIKMIKLIQCFMFYINSESRKLICWLLYLRKK